MEEKQIRLLKKLTEANGVPGQEEEVREIMSKELEDVADTITKDNLGSFIAQKNNDATSPRIMIAGHMDEVGFIVKKIDKNGFIKFQNLGGWWSHSLLSQEVKIITSKGDEITGVIGAKPPHLLEPEERKKVLKIKDMFIDIGASSKEDVENAGIKIGDMIVPKVDFEKLVNKKYLKSKAFDNRLGCAASIEVMNNLHNEPSNIYSVGSVQEEVGMRGASTVTEKIKPDIAFTVDATIAKDTPNISDDENKLGNGPLVVVMDAVCIGNKKLRDFALKIVDELNINVELEINDKGGTDAGNVHKNGEGVPTLGFSIPTRYIHTHSSIIHYDDYKNLVKLITEITKRIDNEFVKDIL